MLISAVGLAIIAAVGFWLFGGVLLRTGGIILATLGLILAVYGSAAGIAALIIGVTVWLVGHWHYALRNHHYKSPLARRIFLQLLPERLDPTRGWGIPAVPPEPPMSRSRWRE